MYGHRTEAATYWPPEHPQMSKSAETRKGTDSDREEVEGDVLTCLRLDIQPPELAGPHSARRPSGTLGWGIQAVRPLRSEPPSLAISSAVGMQGPGERQRACLRRFRP